MVNDQVKRIPLFDLGQTVATPGALEAIEEADETAIQIYFWHQCGNWDNLDPEDAAENDRSVKEGFRILSAYILSTETKVWVITEADRSATTILLPSEY